jgi:hypothetical protein
MKRAAENDRVSGNPIVPAGRFVVLTIGEYSSELARDDGTQRVSELRFRDNAGRNP